MSEPTIIDAFHRALLKFRLPLFQCGSTHWATYAGGDLIIRTSPEYAVLAAAYRLDPEGGWERFDLISKAKAGVHTPQPTAPAESRQEQSEARDGMTAEQALQ